MNTKFFWLITAILLVHIPPAGAQQLKKIPRIGYISVSGNANRPGRNVEAFREGLRDLGYEEGKNIIVEYRYTSAAPDKVSDFVTELVQGKVDALVSSSTGAIRAARQTTRTIPIIMISPGDPIETGLIDSLAHPGGNITGVSRFARELSGKRLEVFTELVPGLARVGVLAAAATRIANDYEAAARSLKLML